MRPARRRELFANGVEELGYSDCVSPTSCYEATAPPQSASDFTTDRRSSAMVTISALPSTSPLASPRPRPAEKCYSPRTPQHSQPALDGIFYQSRGRQTLRNIREPIGLFAAISQGQPPRGKLPIDPVRQMAVDPQRAVGRLTHEDTAYYFCTLTCAADFPARERFIGRSRETQ
jgi:YHS domain-containing protein